MIFHRAVAMKIRLVRVLAACVNDHVDVVSYPFQSVSDIPNDFSFLLAPVANFAFLSPNTAITKVQV